MVWVWVRTVANGVAGAVANGSEPSRMVRTVTIGFGCRSSSRMVQTIANGSDRRRKWFRLPSVVANGSEPSRIVIGDGLGAIGDGEARQRLGLGVRRLGLGATATGFGFQKNKN